ncbi:MAG: leucine-rich repeat domain-containing protein, partial [Clostridia bacterium]|nr:leucine-rich repeat domain-containing protein [Clostridia bacterium]
MKTKFKLSNRILSIVLALVLMVGILPMTSFTASATETEYDGVIGELYYKVDQENNVTTIFGNGALSSVSSLANVMTSNVVIEEGVTSIGNTAFRGLSSLEELTVKGDVTIGNYAFQGCASLETVTFMGNVTSVGYNAFYGCASLTNINYYGTTEPSYTNTLSYITLYSLNGVPFCGLIPSNSPATEVSGWNTNMVAYSDGVTQYFTYNNYLYQVKYTNLKTVSETRIDYDRYGNMICPISSSVHVSLYASDLGQRITTDMFPQTPGSVLNCYGNNENRVIDTSKPVVVITCIAVNEPIWSWNGTASATATFIAKNADVFTKANATISSETVSEATNCQTKEQIKYTATVTFNGQTYTDTKSVYGAVGPHSYTYTADGNTITETCDNGCGHTATATLTATDATYAGSPITTGAYVIYSDGWAGSQEHGEITYSNNLNVGDATAKVTVAAKELVTTFKINPANITETTVTFDPENGIYNGSAYTPGVTVTFNGTT